VSLDPPGPVPVGSVVTVNLAVSGWDAADGEVDAVAFRVDFDPAFFEFVPGSGVTLADGTEFLALPTQGDGYVLGDESSDSLVEFGRYLFGATDLVDSSGGSVGPDGPLGSFQLKAIAVGSSHLTPNTSNPDEVFVNTGLNGISPTGGIDFNLLPVTTVVPVTYASWAAGFAFPPGQGDPEDDPDGDLVLNVMEYGLDMNPVQADREKLPVLGMLEDGGVNHLSLTYQRPAGSKARSDLSYEHRRSTDLSAWSGGGVTVESISPPDPVTELETVVIRSISAVGAGGLLREFLQLSVSL